MPAFIRLRASVVLAWLVVGSAAPARAADAFDPPAEEFVKLALAIGQHAPDYVDAYHGPAEWRTEAAAAGRRPLAELAETAERTLAAVQRVPVAENDRVRALRRDFLVGQLSSARAYLRLLAGETFSFDDEAKALYGVEPPHEPLERFVAIPARIDALLPGEGPVTTRYVAWREQFAVPPDRIAAITQVAIAEARRRTLAHVALPPQESFALELVVDKPWGAYNWYQGDARSLIQVNTSLPVYVSQIVHYAAHEGYPGHHVYNVLQEETLVRQSGRLEHTILPLFSPLALIAEGSAEAGALVVFPAEERLRFEREVLFPQAGLPVDEAARYAEVRELVKDLGRARVQLAREYLEGRMSREQVTDWLSRHGLVTEPEAERSVRFFDTYRSYIVNYSVGEEIVLAWLEARAGQDPAARWDALIDLLRSPRLPAALLERPAR